MRHSPLSPSAQYGFLPSPTDGHSDTVLRTLPAYSSPSQSMSGEPHLQHGCFARLSGSLQTCPLVSVSSGNAWRRVVSPEGRTGIPVSLASVGIG